MLGAMVLMLALAPAQPAWEQVQERDGISVFVRDVPGGRVREVRAEMSVPISAGRILDVLGDLRHYVEFMPYVTEARLLSTFENGHYEYQVIDPPIVAMRDYALRVTVTRTADGTIERSWSEANDKAPPLREGMVRVALNRGKWALKPEGDQKTHVTYYLYTDPGGSIPAWIANQANTTSLPHLMTALRERSLDPTWKRDSR